MQLSRCMLGFSSRIYDACFWIVDPGVFLFQQYAFILPFYFYSNIHYKTIGIQSNIRRFNRAVVVLYSVS